jgi:hypothetical protein
MPVVNHRSHASTDTSNSTDSILPSLYGGLTDRERTNLFEYGLVPRRPSPLYIHPSLRRTRLEQFSKDESQADAYNVSEADRRETGFSTVTLFPRPVHVNSYPPIFNPGDPPDWYPKWRWAMRLWNNRQDHRLIGAAVFVTFLSVAACAVALFLTVGNTAKGPNTAAHAYANKTGGLVTPLVLAATTTVGLAEEFPTGFISIPTSTSHGADESKASAMDTNV